MMNLKLNFQVFLPSENLKKKKQIYKHLYKYLKKSQDNLKILVYTENIIKSTRIQCPTKKYIRYYISIENLRIFTDPNVIIETRKKLTNHYKINI